VELAKHSYDGRIIAGRGHYPMPQLDLVRAIKYEMEENDLTQKGLIKYFGTKSRVSDSPD
jgi:antitoxin component HigA of HigAB toxin-antitoxin module